MVDHGYFRAIPCSDGFLGAGSLGAASKFNVYLKFWSVEVVLEELVELSKDLTDSPGVVS